MSDLKERCMAYESDLTAQPFSYDGGPGGDGEWCVTTTSSNLTGCDMHKEDAMLFADLVNHYRRDDDEPRYTITEAGRALLAGKG